MAIQNYYAILGVKRDADQDEIKKAYRRLARKYHPDSAGENPKMKAKFQEIQEAYACLSDPVKRRRYNYYGHSAYRASYAAQHGGDSFDDMFNSDFFYEEEEEDGCSGCGECGGEGHDGDCSGDCGGDGCHGGHHHGGHHHGGHHHGGHHHGGASVDDAETDDPSADGVKPGHCGACEEGREAADEEEETPPIHAIRIGVWLTPGEALQPQDKEAMYQEPDISGDKNGRIKKAWHFTVHLPARTYDQKFFYMNQVLDPEEPFLEYANARMKENGKVFIIIVMIRQIEGFTMKGYHLSTNVMVEYPTLVLGGTVVIPGIDGEVEVNIPAGTGTEQQIRVVGRGLACPPKYGIRGDLYVTLRVRIPKTVTEHQRTLLMEFAESLKEQTQNRESCRES